MAEALVRLVATSALAPVGVLDLHDPDQLRRFAATVVPSVIAGARQQATTASPGGSR